MVVSTDSIALLELSVVTNTEHHPLAARDRKEDRYGSLLTDPQQAGFSVNLVTIEVGCLGHFMPQTVSKLSDACHLPKRRILTIRCILQPASRQLVLQSPVHTGSLGPYSVIISFSSTARILLKLPHSKPLFTLYMLRRTRDAKLL